MNTDKIVKSSGVELLTLSFCFRDLYPAHLIAPAAAYSDGVTRSPPAEVRLGKVLGRPVDLDWATPAPEGVAPFGVPYHLFLAMVNHCLTR